MKETLENSWAQILRAELESEYFSQLEHFIEQEREKKEIYPEQNLVFSAFAKTPFENTKVVLLGQDPYHNLGQAMGLSFSVPRHNKIPPSLGNIYRELESDLGISPADHGDLSSWAKQGVLLLNTVLTVEKNKAASHQKKGWEKFTSAVIQTLSDTKENLVFLLWGASAQKAAKLIDQDKHLVLSAAHPSPLARGAFFGSQPFSQTNTYLRKQGKEPINWELK